jgi:hypothetical protein
MRVIHAPTADLAREFSAQKEVVLSVEAEYGDFVAEGTLYTAAHHQGSGPFAGRHVVKGGRPAPCNDPLIPLAGKWDHVLISHVDLDTIGGVMRAGGQHQDLFEPDYQEFWDTAEFVDTHGAHKLPEDHPQAERMYAVWAFLKRHREAYPRDSVVEVTEFLRLAGVAIKAILTGQDTEFKAHELMSHGKYLKEDEDSLSEASWVQTFGHGTPAIIAVRVSEEFTNNLYRDPEGTLCAAIVAFNTVQGSVTISLAEPVEGVSCRDIVQSLWGDEAGGHEGIAGSPRGQRMGIAELLEVAQRLHDKLPNRRV